MGLCGSKIKEDESLPKRLETIVEETESQAASPVSNLHITTEIPSQATSSIEVLSQSAAVLSPNLLSPQPVENGINASAFASSANRGKPSPVMPEEDQQRDLEVLKKQKSSISPASINHNSPQEAASSSSIKKEAQSLKLNEVNILPESPALERETRAEISQGPEPIIITDEDRQNYEQYVQSMEEARLARLSNEEGASSIPAILSPLSENTYNLVTPPLELVRQVANGGEESSSSSGYRNVSEGNNEFQNISINRETTPNSGSESVDRPELIRSLNSEANNEAYQADISDMGPESYLPEAPSFSGLATVGLVGLACFANLQGFGSQL